MAKKDIFAQKAYAKVTESAAATLTFEELSLATELDKKKAMIIHRIEYYPTETLYPGLIGANDHYRFGWATSNSITDVGPDIVEVFDRVVLSYNELMGGGGINQGQAPIVRNFSEMPGGGLIVPVKRMYLFVQGSSVAVAGVVESLLFYTIKDLTDADYIELVEALNLLK